MLTKGASSQAAASGFVAGITTATYMTLVAFDVLGDCVRHALDPKLRGGP